MVSFQKKTLGDGSLYVTIAGKIDEKFDASPITDEFSRGKVVLDHGRHTGALPGRVLRAGPPS